VIRRYLIAAAVGNAVWNDTSVTLHDRPKALPLSTPLAHASTCRRSYQRPEPDCWPKRPLNGWKTLVSETGPYQHRRAATTVPKTILRMFYLDIELIRRGTLIDLNVADHDRRLDHL
jgi:hypothetical protein